MLRAGGHQRLRPVPQPSSDSCSRSFGTAQILFAELSTVLYVFTMADGEVIELAVHKDAERGDPLSPSMNESYAVSRRQQLDVSAQCLNK